MKPNLKTWREAASIILVAKTAFAPTIKHVDFNYKLLTLKRSSKSGYMPGTYVFPGGNLCQADTSRDWLNLYETFGFKFDTFDKLNPKENRPKVFEYKNSDELPKYLSLRIGAIRETFEECGILICRSYKINYKERVARWASCIEGPELIKWQDKIHDNPDNFLELCRKYEIYPDVWALKEWNNWVTPAYLPKKFDTAFFLTAFQQQPSAHAEKQEVQHIEWGSPTDFLVKNMHEEILLPPPQFYEISRLRNFLDIDVLLKFAGERAKEGVERYMPLRIKTKEGMFTILPGDDLYSYEVAENCNEVHFVESLPASNIQNRILHKSPSHSEMITLNFNPKCNHVAPLAWKVTKL